MRSTVVQHPELLFIALLSQWIRTLEQQPTLECFADSLRLHFDPEEPFYGHIYIEGFMNENCHLDYSQNPIATPFYFNVFYGSDCHVRCEIQKEPPGINYHIVVIVQHHYLFLTQADRVYSINCFYQSGFDRLTQNMGIEGGFIMKELGSGLATICTYDVLKDSVNGEPVKYANVGDRLIHKWSCKLEKYGMLVHSCFTYKSDGTKFQLLDNRGCIIDRTLMDPLIYSESLTVAYSVVRAFKFVNQPTISFQCKVTFCDKVQNNCKGISGEHTTSSSLTFPDTEQTTSEEDDEYESYYDLHDDVNANKLTASKISNVKHISNRRKRFLNESELAMNPLSLKFHTEANFTNANRLTLDVSADQLVIFECNEMNQRSSLEVAHVSCEVLRNGLLFQTVIFILLTVLFLTIIFVQKHCKSKRLIKYGFV